MDDRNDVFSLTNVNFLRRDFLKSCAIASLSVVGAGGRFVFAEDERKFHNPILPGSTADPEVLFSRKTGRVYVYPTSGNGFQTWSTDNLVDWHYCA